MVDLDELSQQYMKLRREREVLAEKYKEADIYAKQQWDR